MTARFLPGLARPAVATRLRQGLAALRPRVYLDDDLIDRVLTPAQAAAFRALSPFDQSHLIAVYRYLDSNGETDPDVLTAALLHDIAKVDPSERVGLSHRVVRVLLRRLAPALLARLAAPGVAGWRHGLSLAVHHPALGAARAADLGCTPRTCWLIARHEDRDPPADAGLRRLIAADHTS